MHVLPTILLLPGVALAQSLPSPAASPSAMPGMAMPPPCMLTCLRNTIATSAPGSFCQAAFVTSLSNCVVQSCPAAISAGIKDHIPQFCAAVAPHMGPNASPGSSHPAIPAFPPSAIPHLPIDGAGQHTLSCSESAGVPTSTWTPSPAAVTLSSTWTPSPAVVTPSSSCSSLHPTPPPGVSILPPLPYGTPQSPAAPPPQSPTAIAAAHPPAIVSPYTPPLPVTSSIPCEQPTVSATQFAPEQPPVIGQAPHTPSPSPYAPPPVISPLPYMPSPPLPPSPYGPPPIHSHTAAVSPVGQPPAYIPGTGTAWQMPQHNSTKPYAPVGTASSSGYLNTYPVYASPTPTTTSHHPTTMIGAIGAGNSLNSLSISGTLLTVALMTVLLM